MEGERRECLDAYYLQPPPPYPNILPPSTAASQQSLETASVIFDSAYNSDHTPEETEDGAVGGQATAVAAAAAVTAAASNKKKGEGKENNITVTLADRDLWKEFYKVGNEMIVTKPGRRLFPGLVVTMKGLNPNLTYSISLRVTPADLYRYKFLNMHWSSVGESEINQNERKQIYRHPSSPNTGAFWMRKPISFRAIKITHSPISKNGNILVHTMHKYVMEVIVSPSHKSGDKVIRLEETTFVAVSAYQNTNLTQLKIENNPFAKGFRDRGQGAVLQHRPVPPRPHISPFQPHLQSFGGTALPSLQFYRGDTSYRQPLVNQTLQTLSFPSPLLSSGSPGTQSPNLGCSPIAIANGQPAMGTMMGGGGTQLSTLTPTIVGTGYNQQLPQYTPTIVGSGCSQLPQYTPTIVGSGCAQLSPTQTLGEPGTCMALPPPPPPPPPPMSPPESLSPAHTPTMLSPPALGNNCLAQLYSTPGYSFYTQPHPGVTLPSGYNPPPTPPQ